MQNYLIIGSPFVILFLALPAIFSPDNNLINYAINHYRIFWNIFSIGFMLWFIVLFLFLVCLIIAPTVREKTLTRLANLKERDEREEHITGKAARSAYISTLSVMILCLFLSMFNVSLYKLPKNNTINAYRYRLSMDFHYHFFNKVDNAKIPGEIAVFDLKDIFPSTSTIIFILLGWQLLAFNFTARREMSKDI